MKKCKRTIHAALVVGLLVAALPVVAQPSTHDGQTAFGIFARIEAVVAKLWPFTAIKPADTETSGGSTASEAVGAIGKIGIDISIGGVALQSPEDPENPSGSGTGSSSDSQGG